MVHREAKAENIENFNLDKDSKIKLDIQWSTECSGSDSSKKKEGKEKGKRDKSNFCFCL